PITFIIRRKIRQGRQTDFEKWSQGIAQASQRFEGYLGIRIIYPEKLQKEFVTILSFDSYKNYLAWEKSSERMVWMRQVKDMTVGEETSEFVKGFDYWLGSDDESSRSWPPDFRMILIAFAAIWPLVYFLAPLLVPFLPQNSVLASLASTAIITLLMGYVTLPVITQICRRWL
ncbi:MAG: hypothetical protein ACR2PS_03015, partial [Pseudomonadales bacterium]